MFKRIFTLLLPVFFSIPVIAQTTFRLSYDVASFDIAGGMVQSPAGDFVMAGTNASFIPLYGNVIKIDANANFVWAKSYVGGIATDFSDIKNVTGGGYIISGSSSDGGAILIKIDNSGNTVWSYRYQCADKPGKSSSEGANAVIETSDGGFLVGGSVSYFWDGVSANTVDTSSALGFKVNANGILQWSRVWTIATTNPDEHFINDVAETADGYYFVGESSEGSGTASDGDYPRNALLIKTAKTGALTYLRRWGAGNSSSEGINCAIKLTSGANNDKVLLGGYDGSNAFMITESGNGSSPVMGSFARRVNGSSFPPATFVIQDIMENSDGNFSAIGMNIQLFSFYSSILKINSSSGALIFGRGYLPIGPLAAILPEGGLASDQGYYMTMTDQQTGGFNYNIIRTDNQGNMGTGSTGSSCSQTTLTPTTGTYSVTLSTPTYTEHTNPATSASFTPVVTTLSPTPVMDCSNIPCTPPPNPTSSSATTICQGQSATITASGSGSVTYNVYANSSGGSALGSTPYTVSPTITTTYHIEAFNSATSCSSARTPVTITVIPTQNPAWTSPGSVCQGGSAVNLNTTITGTAGGTFTGTGVTGNSFNPATAGPGTHTITYSVGASPCTATEQHDIVVEPTVTATWNAPATICQSAGVVDLSTLITGTTGGAFSGPGVTGNNFDPVAAGVGSHAITYTVGNAPCQATSPPQNITVITDVDPAWSSPGAVCESLGSINLNTLITGTTGGTWSGTGVTGNTFDPTGLSGAIPVTYTVGSSPCSEISTQSITVTSAVSAAWTTPGTICEAAGNVNLTGLVTGSPGGTWSGTGVSGTTFNPTGLTGPIAITYSVGVTPCNDAQTFNITVTPDVNPAWTSPGAICEASGSINLNTLLTGTTGGTWSGTGVTGNVFNPTGLSGAIPITYTVGTSPCVEVSTQSISVTSTVSAEWTTPDSICEAAGNVNLNTFVTGNPGGSWSGTGVTGNTFNPTGLTGPVAITYNVGVTPCTDAKTYNISVVPNVDPAWTAPATICEVQGIIDLNTLVTGTAGGTWSGTNVSGNSFDPSGLSGSSVSITYTVGAAPCVETSVHSITIGNVSAAWAAPDSICESDGVLSLTSLVTGTAGGSWSGAGVAGTSFDPVGLSGLVQVTYVVGTAPCIDSLVLEIPVKASPADPAVTALADEICFGQSTTISATGGGAGAVYNVYSASTGGNLIGTTSLLVSPTATTTYYVESESVSGCINLGGRSTVTVTVNELPPANAGTDQTICSGSSAVLTASGGVVYEWNTGATTASINVTPSNGSWYSVKVTDNKGCENTDSLFVEVFFPGAIAALNDTATGENETVLTIDVADNDSQTGAVVHVITQPAHGTADVNSDNQVVYTPEGGYDGIDSIQYAICDSFCGSFCDTAWAYVDVLTFFIPSGISPNGDGVNDEFEIVGLFKFPQHHLQIFNRWGDLLYDAQPYNNDWHGQHNKGMVLGGDEVVEGTYFYIFYPNATDAETKKGSIELRKQ